MDTRRTLLELFDASLRAVDGRLAVAAALRNLVHPRVAVFGMGKAASAMASGAVSAFGERLQSLWLVTKDGHVDPQLRAVARSMILEAAHPVPDERSLAAGAQLESRIRELPPEVFPVFLVSGGSSSLVESLRADNTLADLRALTTRGLSAGLDIATLNAQRAQISRLKRGGVARLLGARAALALFISDVPGDDPDLIGSGLLGGDAGRADSIERVVVASVADAVRAAVAAAQARGLELQARVSRFDGEAGQVAAQFVESLRATHADGLVWGGESTVRLPETHGRGGRNTHLALGAARLLRAGEPLTILAAGTDGTDGPTEDAGAIVDAGTIARAEIGGVDVERAFREFDSGIALEASEDLLHTGPTGTNVGDLLIGIKCSATSVRDAALGRML
jgi:hydroxypyruvate reductase